MKPEIQQWYIRLICDLLHFTIMVNVLKFHTPKLPTKKKWHMQTVQTQIRLFLKSYPGLQCLPFQYFKELPYNKQNLGKKGIAFSKITVVHNILWRTDTLSGEIILTWKYICHSQGCKLLPLREAPFEKGGK